MLKRIANIDVRRKTNLYVELTKLRGCIDELEQAAKEAAEYQFSVWHANNYDILAHEQSAFYNVMKQLENVNNIVE